MNNYFLAINLIIYVISNICIYFGIFTLSQQLNKIEKRDRKWTISIISIVFFGVIGFIHLFVLNYVYEIKCFNIIYLLFGALSTSIIGIYKSKLTKFQKNLTTIIVFIVQLILSCILSVFGCKKDYKETNVNQTQYVHTVFVYNPQELKKNYTKILKLDYDNKSKQSFTKPTEWGDLVERQYSSDPRLVDQYVNDKKINILIPNDVIRLLKKFYDTGELQRIYRYKARNVSWLQPQDFTVNIFAKPKHNEQAIPIFRNLRLICLYLIGEFDKLENYLDCTPVSAIQPTPKKHLNTPPFARTLYIDNIKIDEVDHFQMFYVAAKKINIKFRYEIECLQCSGVHFLVNFEVNLEFDIGGNVVSSYWEYPRIHPIEIKPYQTPGNRNNEKWVEGVKFLGDSLKSFYVEMNRGITTMDIEDISEHKTEEIRWTVKDIFEEIHDIFKYYWTNWSTALELKEYLWARIHGDWYPIMTLKFVEQALRHKHPNSKITLLQKNTGDIYHVTTDDKVIEYILPINWSNKVIEYAKTIYPRPDHE